MKPEQQVHQTEELEEIIHIKVQQLKEDPEEQEILEEKDTIMEAMELEDF